MKINNHAFKTSSSLKNNNVIVMLLIVKIIILIQLKNIVINLNLIQIQKTKLVIIHFSSKVKL